MTFKKSRTTIAKTLGTFALVFLVITTCTCLAAKPENISNPQSIRVVMDDNYPPYVFKNEQGKLQGIIIDQWKLWEKKTGIRVEITGTDWSEAQRKMQSGEFDVIDTMFRNEQREALYAFSKAYARIDVPLFFHEDISGIRGPEDLKGFLVAAKAGDNAIDVLKKKGVTNITEFPSYEKLIEAARDGRVKVFTVDRPPALYFLNKLGIQNRFRETKPLYHGEFHRAVLQGNAALLAVVERGFAAIPKSDLEAIDQRWMGTTLAASPFFRYALYSIGVIAVLVLVLVAWLWSLRRTVSRKTHELAVSEERYRTILKTAMSGFCRTDMHGRLLEVNESYSQITGYTEQELLTMSVADLEAKETAVAILERMKRIIEHGEAHFESRHRRKDGTLFDVEISLKFQPANGGECVAFVQDISERKRIEEERQALEQQFQHAQKLESLGVLAGGIAHDFNNILAIIIGNCSLAIMAPDTADRRIPEIEKAAERAAGLCRQMLAYAGKTESVMTQVNMRDLVDDMVRMLKSTISRNVEIKTDLQDEVSAIIGDPSQLRQVVMNLIINGSESIGESQGRVIVSLTKRAIGTDQLEKDHLGTIIPSGRYACLEVTDNGCGMDDDTKQRIFEPFYTTKFTGRGLGLSAVLGIISAHKGTLQIFSQPGKGTTFKIYLPIKDGSDSVGEESIDRPSPEQWQGCGTVLLVEDEESIMSVAKSMLELLGFRVIEACNGEEALEMYLGNAKEIAMVLTDIGMPIMDGYSLIRELKTLNPELPIIVSSGFGDTVVASKIPNEAIAESVSKPYNFDQLREVLKRIFEGTHLSSITVD